MFIHITRMFRKRLARRVHFSVVIGNLLLQPLRWCWTRTKLHEYISVLASSCEAPSAESAELSDIYESRDVFQNLLWLLTPPSKRYVGTKLNDKIILRDQSSSNIQVKLIHCTSDTHIRARIRNLFHFFVALCIGWFELVLCFCLFKLFFVGHLQTNGNLFRILMQAKRRKYVSK